MSLNIKEAYLKMLSEAEDKKKAKPEIEIEVDDDKESDIKTTDKMKSAKKKADPAAKADEEEDMEEAAYKVPSNYASMMAKKKRQERLKKAKEDGASKDGMKEANQLDEDLPGGIFKLVNKTTGAVAMVRAGGPSSARETRDNPNDWVVKKPTDAEKRKFLAKKNEEVEDTVDEAYSLDTKAIQDKVVALGGKMMTKSISTSKGVNNQASFNTDKAKAKKFASWLKSNYDSVFDVISDNGFGTVNFKTTGMDEAVEDLEELSRDTLDRYHDKASDDREDQADNHKDGYNSARAKKRAKGMAAASKRLRAKDAEDRKKSGYREPREKIHSRTAGIKPKRPKFKESVDLSPALRTFYRLQEDKIDDMIDSILAGDKGSKMAAAIDTGNEKAIVELLKKANVKDADIKSVVKRLIG